MHFLEGQVIMQPPWGPKGRGVADRGNAGGALVFLSLLWLLYAMGVYT